jgi:putative nucleotidyltransferase with HDIG domain
MRTPVNPICAVDSNPAARELRVLKLSEELGQRLRSSPGHLLGLCRDFDSAVEFAALEGKSVRDAITEFIGEGYIGQGYIGERHAVPATAGWPELARLSGYGRPPIDVALISLPVMPKHVVRLLRTSSSDTSAVELDSIASSDPVLTGMLLGAANSASYGSKFEIVRLLDAIMRLGIPYARRILVRACLSGLFGSKPLQDLWEHSEDVAGLSFGLALFAGIDAETAFVAGLLHDIGRLAIARSATGLRQQEQEWLSAGFPFVYAETLTYGSDHAALGAECLHNWGLPGNIVEAVGMHHRPESSESPLSAVITLAEDLTARDDHHVPEDLWPGMRRRAACFTAGISLDQLEEFYSAASPKQAHA